MSTFFVRSISVLFDSRVFIPDNSGSKMCCLSLGYIPHNTGSKMCCFIPVTIPLLESLVYPSNDRISVQFDSMVATPLPSSVLCSQQHYVSFHSHHPSNQLLAHFLYHGHQFSVQFYNIHPSTIRIYI